MPQFCKCAKTFWDIFLDEQVLGLLSIFFGLYLIDLYTLLKSVSVQKYRGRDKLRNVLKCNFGNYRL